MNMRELTDAAKGSFKLFTWVFVFTIFWVIYIGYGTVALFYAAKISTALTGLAMTYLALDKVFDQSKFSNRIWKWFDTKKWLHWYAQPKNGMMKIVLFIGALIFPAKLLLEIHWSVTNPEIGAQAYSPCEGGWQWALSSALWNLYFMAVVGWMITNDFSRLVVAHVKDDPVRISQHLIWQLAVFLTITTIGITILEPQLQSLEQFREDLVMHALNRCEQ